MNAELLYEALNDSKSLEELNERELGRLVSTYPYFSVGQLLLAKKLKQNNDPESYQKQREHLHAFYRNPWWLYYQLELTDHYATPPYISQGPYRYEPPHPAAPFESIAQAAVPHLGAGTPLPFEEETPVIEEAPVIEETPVIEESAVEAPADSAHTRESQPQHTPWPGMVEEEAMDIPTLMGTIPVAQEPISAPKASVAEPYLPYMVTSALEEMPAEMPEEAAGKVPAEATPEVQTEIPADILEEPLYPAEEPDLAEDPDATEATPAGLEGSNGLPPSFPTGEPAPFPFSITPLSHDFTFEPLHTVDYFASQGIKLNLEENANDNLTRHLKSFTEWLRAMKRVSPMDNLRGELDAATEAEIQQLASSANHQREAIVTESMAHVWVLQGKIHKAVEVYNKLSLQHPEKRAYFAAKIEQLNRL